MLPAGSSSDNKSNDSGNKTGNQQNAKPKTGGKLTVLWSNDVDYIDCGATYYQMGSFLCYSTQRPLYNYKPDDATTLVPDSAEAAPEVSADAKTITIKIRQGVKFSPPVNRAVTSKDVKYAIERGFFNTVNNGYAGAYFGNIDGAKVGVKPGTTIKGLETPDDQTLIIHLTKPTAGVLAAGGLAMPLTAPVPEEYAAKFDKENPSTYGDNQVSTGPYMIENNAAGKAIGYEPGKRIHLVRNPNWDKSTDFKPAYLDEIDNLEGNDDTGVASRQILTGKAMINGDFSPPPESLKQASTQYKDQLQLVPSGGGRWVSMNMKLKPFDDINVRKAVIAGFDRNALRLARGGTLIGDMPTHYIPPGMAGFDQAGGLKGFGLDFMNESGAPNPALSAEYFKKAGMASGKYEGKDEILMVGDNSGVATKVAELAKTNFEQLGFKVKLRLVEHNVMYTKYCNVARRGRHGVPERRLAEGLRRRADDAGPDVQRQEHHSGEQLQLVAAQRPDDQRRDGQGRGPRQARGAGDGVGQHRQDDHRAGPRGPVPVGQEPGDPVRQRQRCRLAQLRAVGHLLDVAEVGVRSRGPAHRRGRDSLARERP